MQHSFNKNIDTQEFLAAPSQRAYHDGESYSRGREGVRGGRGGGRGGYNNYYERNNNNYYNNEYNNNSSFGGYGRGGGARRGGRGGFARGGRPPMDRDFEEPFTRQDMPEEQLFEEAVNSGINFDKYDDIPVEIVGDQVPDPIEDFADAKMHPWLTRNLERARYGKPTPVQKHGLPIVMAGRDMMACAQTGSGKTAGFLFPMIDLLLKDAIAAQRTSQMKEIMQREPELKSELLQGFRGMNPEAPAKPLALILAPTRELCLQLYDETRKFTFHTPIRTVALFGGSSIQAQAGQLQRGCHIVVATPGRLSDMIERGMITMSDIRFLVLDEADRMLDMGFEPQIRRIVEEEHMPVPGKRQTLMYSATFPKEIQFLASSFLHDYVFLTVGRVGSTSENITQRILHVEDVEKQTHLIEMLRETDGNNGLSLVFVSRKSTADYLEGYLTEYGFKAISIHGDKSQRRRDFALNSFKSGHMRVLVATEVAARGLDIGNVQHVINFDLPDNIDSYVHRIGRTGRAGNVGTATSFFNMDTNPGFVKDLIKVLEETKMEVPTFLSDAIVQHQAMRYSNRQAAGRRPSSSSYGGRRSGYGDNKQSFSFRGGRGRDQHRNDSRRRSNFSEYDDEFDAEYDEEF